MQKYKDTNHDSNVDSFEINATSISVWFKGTPEPYVYSYQSAGQHHIEEMKRLAQIGDGLNSYIMTNVKIKYVR